MNKLISVALYVTFFVNLFSTVCAGEASIVTEVSDGAVFVITPLGQSQVLHVSHPASKDDIAYEDLNFDGYIDIKVFRSAGNIEKFYDVYLFDPVTKRYKLSKDFSNVPCVASDPKVRQVIGACFHISACENWIERYSVDRLNRLHLRSKEGTYCDPSTGDSFSYIDLFRNGKRISSKSTRLHNDGENNRQ
ncbi:XAC2610-related protein [Burkholderia sp. AW33-5]